MSERRMANSIAARLDRLESAAGGEAVASSATATNRPSAATGTAHATATTGVEAGPRTANGRRRIGRTREPHGRRTPES